MNNGLYAVDYGEVTDYRLPGDRWVLGVAGNEYRYGYRGNVLARTVLRTERIALRLI